MNFIVDAQLPKSHSDYLNFKGLDSIHTLDLTEGNAISDKKIIEISIKEERVVITKDYDFLESFVLKSLPKKLIIVKTGNIPNNQLIKIFGGNLENILSIIQRSNLIEIHPTEIIEHE